MYAALVHLKLTTRRLNPVPHSRILPKNTAMSDSPLLLIGTYTDNSTDGVHGIGEGVLGYAFDPATGALDRRFAHYIEQPTYLAVDQKRGLLYANQEIEQEGQQPCMHALRLTHDAAHSGIEPLDTQPLRGCVPCHIGLRPGKALWIAGYKSSNLSRIPLTADGRMLPQSHNLKFEGSGPREEQDTAHIHCCAYDAVRDRLFVCDLGADRVRVLVPDGDDWREDDTLSLTVRAGSGPRHLLPHPTDTDRLLLMHELWPEVSVLDISARPRELFRFLPFDPPDETSQGGAAIRTCNAGRFVYVSERKTNSVAILAYEGDTLRLVQRVSTHGEKPRDINLSPDGRWLLAANLNSHTLALFRRDTATGKLTFERLEEGVKSPSCVAWLEE